MSQVSVAVLLTGTLAYIIKKYMSKNPLDDIPGPPSQSLLFGSLEEIVGEDAFPLLEKLIDTYGGVMKINGLLGERHLFLHDPKALHHILIKDQNIYEEAGFFIAMNRMVLGDGLLSVLGDQHKKQRKMLNPVFSIAHMREMTPIFYEVVNRMNTTVSRQVQAAGGSMEVDMMSWMTRTALELIGKSGMGYSFDDLQENESINDPISRSVKRFGTLAASPENFIASRYIYPLALKLNIPKIKRWIADHFPLQWAQDVKEISDILHTTAVDICEKKKKKAIRDGDPDMAYQKDIISILIKANESAAEEDRMSESEVYGQVATLILAAMETTSSALARVLHLLVTHPEVQEKLRNEIIEARGRDGSNELDYDHLVHLPYLDAVVRETLRLHPPLTVVFRTARNDMVLPLSKPITNINGKQLTELLIPNGTTLLLSILGANRDSAVWGEDAKEWKPERWLQDLPESVGDAKMPGIYSNLMTFLGGSRACIGFKFSQLEIKVVLFLLLSTFKLEDTGKKIKWRNIGSTTPKVEGTDNHASLPIILTLLEKK